MIIIARSSISSKKLFLSSRKHFLESMTRFLSSRKLFLSSMTHFLSSKKLFFSSMTHFLSSRKLFLLSMTLFLSSRKLFLESMTHAFRKAQNPCIKQVLIFPSNKEGNIFSILSPNWGFSVVSISIHNY
jgi:hypothetical protein